MRRGVKDINLDYLRAIAEASDGGRRCVLAFGDWNLTPEELEASGVLEGLGLEIVTPTNSTISCTAGRQGSLIDYVIVTQGYRSIIQTCEVVREAPCGTHMGVRTTLVSDPASIRANTLRRPQSLESAVDFFSKKDLVTLAARYPVGSRLGGRPMSEPKHMSWPTA